MTWTSNFDVGICKEPKNYPYNIVRSILDLSWHFRNEPKGNRTLGNRSHQCGTQARLCRSRYCKNDHNLHLELEKVRGIEEPSSSNGCKDPINHDAVTNVIKSSETTVAIKSFEKYKEKIYISFLVRICFCEPQTTFQYFAEGESIPVSFLN